MLDPTRLLLLLALREHGSVTRAAEQLDRTPPAVSQQLLRLEDEVGAQLVERLPHGVRLTPLGTRMAERAERIAAALQDATSDAQRFRDEHRNRLRLGAFPTAGLALLPEALAAMRHRHPDAELSVVDLGPVEGIERVAAQRLDLALVGEYREPIEAAPGVRLVHLLDDPIHAVLPDGHPRAWNTAPQLADFRDDTWAGAPTDLPNRQQLDAAARAEGFTPRVAFEFESYAVAEAVVSAGVAVAFIPRLAITGTPGTTHQPLASGLHRRIHAAVPTSTRHAPLTEVFLQLLHSISRDLSR
ncbi:LysR family transcriptional regulator [Saccharopolyspora hirsuta]|uniref:LysR family transcriptional regulator n=1 Tax=Saccharopolyspora hirsuta TaxID=1837 RepID=A0A5M7BR76_SACHI|nr:LysR family transcriptional regulator [Saccharopolyspora hirsuta]KAA5832746.1 LysR family transcriptional regulator [Saccharopolyspora hirsuta]